ncbi:MAG: ribokinase [Chloroflexota bacterium]
MSGRVIVVGSINADLVIRGERLPSVGETVTGGTFERHHGGKGGNQAVAAARLGASVSFVGAVGDDPFGLEARTALIAEGIDVAGLATLGGRATGVALILVDRDGENLISVASGANAALELGAIGPAFAGIGVGPGDVVLVCHELPTATVREALQSGRARGARTVLNPAPAHGIDRTVLAAADVISPNRGELLTLTSTDARRSGRASTYGPAAATDVARAARSLLEVSAAGPGVAEAVVVTLGPVGALLVRADSTVDVPSIAVEALDTTGAGDAFNGALAAGMVEGRPIDEAVRRAVVAGALATTRVGAREGMPTTAELDAALEA